MEFIESLRDQIRYTGEALRFVRRRLTPEQGRRIFEEQMASRHESFLYVLEHAVYENPKSPYLRLLQHAGIEFADVSRRVREEGLEAALEWLHDAGVYVTQDELKARLPIRRNGLEFPVKQSDFDNPLLKNALTGGTTSGSSGTPTQMLMSFDAQYYRTASDMMTSPPEAEGRPVAYWSTSGGGRILRHAQRGWPPAKTFVTAPFQWNGRGFRQLTTLAVAWLSGHRAGWPEYARRDQAVKVAKWLAKKRAEGTPAYIYAHASPAVRVCLAAKEHGLDISGTLFGVGGEPFTPGKQAVMASTGVITRPMYAMRETGSPAGMGCPNGIASDDIHIITDRLAMIHRDHEFGPDMTVTALIYTSLLPVAPKLLLNWYSGDYATVEERDCGCYLQQLGMTTHVYGIQSFEKLTSEGVTFAGSLLYRLVEEVLPARIGGQVGDYQLVEEEEDGLPRVRIVVSPRVGPVDEAEVIAIVMENLESSHEGAGGKEMTEQWRQADTLQVVRREPAVTRTMKILPLRVRLRAEEPVRAGADD